MREVTATIFATNYYQFANWLSLFLIQCHQKNLCVENIDAG